MPSARRDLSRLEVAPGPAPSGPGAALLYPHRGALTDQERARIEQLHGRGIGAHRIGADIGRAPQTVQSYLYRAGLKAPKPLEKPTSYRRGDRLVQRFTEAEDVFIEALRIQAFKPAEIARATNKRFNVQRCPETIRIRLQMLAARETCK